MEKPNAKVTAGGLAGIGITLFWEMVVQFSTFEPRATLVATSVTFVTSLVAYYKRETPKPNAN